MNEANHAVLDNLREFFSRVDSARNSVSPIEEPHSDPIDVKDFVALCNKPESCTKDDAYKLGETVLTLNGLDESKLKGMKAALKNNTWNAWCEDNGIKASADDATFYLVLKRRTDDQQHYHFYFDKDTVAEIDAFDPFLIKGKNGERFLNQQWHVLISELAYLDVAHALSNEQHEYHCLYQHIKSWDMGDLGALHLQLLCSPNQPENRRIKLQLVKPETAPKPRTITYPSEAMNGWLIKALRKLAGK